MLVLGACAVVLGAGAVDFQMCGDLELGGNQTQEFRSAAAVDQRVSEGSRGFIRVEQHQPNKHQIHPENVGFEPGFGQFSHANPAVKNTGTGDKVQIKRR